MLENAKKDMESEKNRCISDTEKLKSKMEELENDSKRYIHLLDFQLGGGEGGENWVQFVKHYFTKVMYMYLK